MKGLAFNVSESARSGLIRILTRGESLLIDVVPGGCNGFSYKYDVVIDVVDEAISVSDIPPVFLTRQASDMLAGATLEYNADEFGTSFFSILNPSATSKCGCGSSFSTFS